MCIQGVLLVKCKRISRPHQNIVCHTLINVHFALFPKIPLNTKPSISDLFGYVLDEIGARVPSYQDIYYKAIEPPVHCTDENKIMSSNLYSSQKWALFYQISYVFGKK